MTLLFWMLVAGFIGDFSLQGEFLTKYKGKFFYVAIVHATIWAGLVCIPFNIIRPEVFEKFILGILLSLIPMHALVDYVKMNSLRGDDGAFDKFLFYADQAFHIGQIVFVWYFF